MKVITSLIVLLALFSSVFSYMYTQGVDITAPFTVTTARYNNGYYTGMFYYSYTTGAMKLVFPVNDLYSELYIFNSDRGEGSYSGQYLYKNSNTCPCETTLLQASMPRFGTTVDTAYWTSAGTTDTYNGVVGNKYTSSSSTSYGKRLLTTLWVTSTGNILAFTMNDARLFVLDQTAYKSSVDNPSSRFVAPTNCKCGKPLDIVISLDRTGSIDRTEWVQEFSFTKNLTRSFDYGALKTNLAILNWNKEHWETIALTSGTSANAVSTAVDNMGCCSSTSSSCCCCGTDIGGGLYKSGEMMLTSSRSTATKAIILLTDGCQNHMYKENQNPPVVPCDCSSEAACASNADCFNDITYHYALVKKKIPTVKVIIVGVGDALCTSQLLEAAGKIEDNVYSTKYWDQLPALVTSLAATACTVDDDLCTGCCGFCSCGVCITPSNCNAPDACSVAAPDASSGGCCAVTPKVCTARNACYTSTCNIGTGCEEVPKPCRPNQTCTYYECDPVDGICKAKPIQTAECLTTPPPTPVPINTPPPPPSVNCHTDSDCDYGDKCLVARCLVGECYYNESVKCIADTACISYMCSSARGCYVTKKVTCNDNDKCTTDLCDDKKGCVFTPIQCPATGDYCLEPICNKLQGCVNTPRSCANFTGNCTVGSCYNNSCHADNVCIPPPPPTGTSDDVPPAVVLGSSLGAAAVVAIIVCAIIAACCVGGGAAFAISQAGAGGGAAATQVNPLYKPTGHQGTNPLFRA